MIAVRVLHDGRAIRELIFSDLPVTIGRGATNGLVLCDDSVSHAHARVEQPEGCGPRLVDLGSRNGLRFGAERVEHVTLGQRTRCWIGATELEIELLPDTPTREIPRHELRRFERRRTLLDQLRYLICGVAGAVAGSVIQPGFWAPTRHTQWGEILEQALTVSVSLPCLAGALFVVLKALGRPLRLADAMKTVSLLVWLIPARSLLLIIAYYPLAPSALAAADNVISFAVCAVAVVAIASIRRAQSIRFMAAWIVVTLLLFAGERGKSALNAKQKGQPTVDLLVQVPIAGYAGRAESLDSYLGRVANAARRVNGGGGTAREAVSR